MYIEKRVFKLQSLLGKIWVHRSHKTKIQEEELIAEEQILRPD